MNGDELRHLLAIHEDISRVMKDPRFPPPNRWGSDLRMFVVTALWVIAVERAPKGTRIPRVCEVMHLDNFHFWELIRSDLPRYEPDTMYRDGGCVAVLPRAKRRCGKGTVWAFSVTNPVDGTWELVGYCSRHREEGRAAEAAERRRKQAGGIPTPLPNRGGLLPCYLPWDWSKNYAKADSNWEPPAVGIRADDWPVLTKVEAAHPTPPKLTVVSGAFEFEEPDASEADAGPPQLRLIGSDKQGRVE
ncbi:hypothetical protein [Microbispora sp. KK1-11]|uniref:hypothetical protein n=1 Tax=Microbispora sp. KK1-11 TaxID=2053005 RepID=UPI00115BBB05|nr:hypothetical protein [Microbispora sp. KK1-11]TQS30030.1 hypothetical protein FLW16_06630 [Microbispora sp. KK1-11]